jgi:transaldolase
MSISPSSQESLVSKPLPHEKRIDQPAPAEVIQRLERLPDFVRAYEPDGMRPADFMGFGATQRTLGQFCDAGWKLMEGYA